MCLSTEHCVPSVLTVWVNIEIIASNKRYRSCDNRKCDNKKDLAKILDIKDRRRLTGINLYCSEKKTLDWNEGNKRKYNKTKWLYFVSK